MSWLTDVKIKTSIEVLQDHLNNLVAQLKHEKYQVEASQKQIIEIEASIKIVENDLQKLKEIK